MQRIAGICAFVLVTGYYVSSYIVEQRQTDWNENMSRPVSSQYSTELADRI